VLAAIFAAALCRNSDLGSFGADAAGASSGSESSRPAPNFAFIFDGEGENGSVGFQEVW
jgi:hypothetical protein